MPAGGMHACGPVHGLQPGMSRIRRASPVADAVRSTVAAPFAVDCAMTRTKTGNEGAFADQTAEGRSDHSEGNGTPGQGSESVGADDGDGGHDAAGPPSRQGAGA